MSFILAGTRRALPQRTLPGYGLTRFSSLSPPHTAAGLAMSKASFYIRQDLKWISAYAFVCCLLLKSEKNERNLQHINFALGSVL